MSSMWDSEQVFFNAKSYFEDMVLGIQAAKHSVELETYIFSNDELGEELCRALVDAAKSGVVVRIMVDGFGSPEWMHIYSDKLQIAGVQSRVFHPLPFSGFSNLIHFFQRISTMNERNHRKVCIVDEKLAWVGGMNISSAHDGWRDTGARISGEGVKKLSIAFENAWDKSWEPDPVYVPKRYILRLGKIVSSKLARLNSTRQERRVSYLAWLNQIKNAKKRIWITNAYFVPPRRLLNALRLAANSGTDVRVLVPKDPPDLHFIRWVSSALYWGLLCAGVRIFEYLPSPLHAKTALIDDIAVIGTTNFNHRSIFHDLEVDVLLSSDQSIAQMVRQFDLDVADSQEVTLSTWRKRPLWHRLVGRMLLLFRYWI